MADAGDDLDAVVAETREYLAVRPETGGWVGETPTWFGPVLFGGFVIAQAVSAVTRTAPDGWRVHSLHAYFLRAVTAATPVHYRVTSLRDGRSFATRQVEATQNDAPVLTMTASFTTDTAGYEYDLPPAPDIGPPDDYVAAGGPGPWIAADIGPTPERADGTRRSTHRHWFRAPSGLPDDPHLHAALIGFATDWTGTGGRPRHLDGDITGMVSLDHAVWFHRPCRADQWLCFDVEALVNAGGRGLLRGTMHDTDGHIVVSVAQEMRLTPVET